MMNKPTFQIMQIEDTNDVYLLEKEIFNIDDKDKIIKTINNENLFYYVLKLSDRVIGFLEGLIISPDAEIYNIAIDKNYRGKGYSKLLINGFIDKCKSAGCETIFLEVNNINQVAINLYNLFDFKSYSVRKNYYGENDAILMRKDL